MAKLRFKTPKRKGDPMSQQTTETITLEDLTFTMGMLDPWVANEILHAISKVIGPSIGELIGATMAKEDGKDLKDKIEESADLLDKKVNPEFLARGVSKLFQNLDVKTSRWIMEELAKVTVIDGKGKLSGSFQVVFMGRIGLMYKWAAWGLNVQLRSFFETIPDAIRFVGQRSILGE